MPTAASKTQLALKSHLNFHQSLIYPNLCSNHFNLTTFVFCIQSGLKTVTDWIKLQSMLASNEKQNILVTKHHFFLVHCLTVCNVRTFECWAACRWLQWCSPVGELVLTAWSRPGARLSPRLPAAPVVSRLTPCVRWQMWARDPALYVTRAYKKLPIKHGEMWTLPSADWHQNDKCIRWVPGNF